MDRKEKREARNKEIELQMMKGDIKQVFLARVNHKGKADMKEVAKEADFRGIWGNDSE